MNFRQWICTIAIGMSLTMSIAAPVPVIAGEGDLSSEQRARLLDTAQINCGTDGKDDCVTGNVESGDFYDVDIHGDCVSNPYFGRIDDKPASLRRTVATTGSRTQNEFTSTPNQLVCIRATARSGPVHISEYYVMALPMDHGPECPGETLCRKPDPATQTDRMLKCRLSDSGADYINCPQGWVFADEIEPYPMGLLGNR
ncbi:hypothetical protein ADU59_08935 [Pararhizobium polonicum]|uniref:Uncharacterized protein n=1 Tax=Pararhizobium polonicum TaxID=1612624 RepID=A0A1C7P3J1_9HYPH|nr:hypothetical protein [Pararhizobium polonicum]OBZ95842.1 hypothetical protein ADU59_08935 [Pararhizobium polonicum]